MRYLERIGYGEKIGENVCDEMVGRRVGKNGWDEMGLERMVGMS
jgi:hypothetical protein